MSYRRLTWMAALILAACTPGRGGQEGIDPEGGGKADDSPSSCTVSGQLRCAGSAVQRCEGGQYRTKMTCVAPQSCVDKLGCVDCPPGGTSCQGDAVYECNADGSFGAEKVRCAAGGCRDGRCTDTCGGQGVDLIYVVDQTYRLLSFNPRGNANEFKLIGRLNCPAGKSLPGWGDIGPATPFSMSVDRDARAWVLYTSGEIFWVSTKDASCMKSPFRSGQEGFELFGMGFVTDGRGSDKESLYISGGAAGMVEDGNLGRVDPAALTVTRQGRLPSNEYGPELTGTGNGELFGYFPSTVRAQVAKIDKANANSLQSWPLQALPGIARAWAFAHWGGRFYIFITTQDGFGGTTSQVQLLDPADGKQTTVLPSIPYVIVGAGVSTCAPVVIE